jgi:hypothetical protein
MVSVPPGSPPGSNNTSVMRHTLCKVTDMQQLAGIQADRIQVYLMTPPPPLPHKINNPNPPPPTHTPAGLLQCFMPLLMPQDGNADQLTRHQLQQQQQEGSTAAHSCSQLNLVCCSPTSLCYCRQHMCILQLASKVDAVLPTGYEPLAPLLIKCGVQVFPEACNSNSRSKSTILNIPVPGPRV